MFPRAQAACLPALHPDLVPTAGAERPRPWPARGQLSHPPTQPRSSSHLRAPLALCPGPFTHRQVVGDHRLRSQELKPRSACHSRAMRRGSRKPVDRALVSSRQSSGPGRGCGQVGATFSPAGRERRAQSSGEQERSRSTREGSKRRGRLTEKDRPLRWGRRAPHSGCSARSREAARGRRAGLGCPAHGRLRAPHPARAGAPAQPRCVSHNMCVQCHACPVTCVSSATRVPCHVCPLPCVSRNSWVTVSPAPTPGVTRPGHCLKAASTVPPGAQATALMCAGQGLTFPGVRCDCGHTGTAQVGGCTEQTLAAW